MMGGSKLLFAWIAISLVIVDVRASADGEEQVVVAPEVSDSALKLELEHLRSKVAALG